MHTRRGETGAGPARIVVAWLLLSGLLLAAALPRVGELGLYYDEAFMAQQARDFVVPERAGNHPGSVRSVWLFGRPFPLRNAAYLGSLKSQLLIPALALAGSTPEVVRTSTLAVGLLALLLCMLWAERIFGTRTALLAGLLVASDPSFFFFSQFEWGPFTTNLLCRCGGLLLATLAWRSPSRRRSIPAAAGAGVLLGLGVFSRADFVVILAAGGLALLIAHPELVARALRERRGPLAAGLLGALTAASPMILSLLDLLRSSSSISDRGDLGFRAQVLAHVLDGSQFHRLMQAGGVFERAAAQSAPASPFVWLLVAAGAWVAVSVLVRRRRRAAAALGDGRTFVLLTSIFVVAGMLAMPGAVRAHHQLNSMPFLQLLIACAVVDLQHRSFARRGLAVAARGASILAVLALLIANLVVISSTYRVISETGGRGRWTSQLTRLAERVDALPGGEVVSLDWGFHEPLNFLTRRVGLVEAIWEIPLVLQQRRPWARSGGPETLYLVHDERYDLFGLGPDFLTAARAIDDGSVRIEEHRDGRGEVAFYSVRMLRPHRLVYTGEFRFY